MNTEINFYTIALYWECSELQFDTLIQKIGYREAEKFMIVNIEKVSSVSNMVSCVSTFEICFENIGLAAAAKNGQFKWWFSPLPLIRFSESRYQIEAQNILNTMM